MISFILLYPDLGLNPTTGPPGRTEYKYPYMLTPSNDGTNTNTIINFMELGSGNNQVEYQVKFTATIPEISTNDFTVSANLKFLGIIGGRLHIILEKDSNNQFTQLNSTAVTNPKALEFTDDASLYFLS